jgi:L-seryl-tRNA(Ser) seleniumtransferase
MIRQSADEIRVRAERVAGAVPGAEIVAGESVIGGGSTPEQTLPTWLLALTGEVVEKEAELRRNDPPVIARIAGERLLIDLRTVFPDEEEALVAALNAARG